MVEMRFCSYFVVDIAELEIGCCTVNLLIVVVSGAN
jgi:hypothetical protein